MASHVCAFRLNIRKELTEEHSPVCQTFPSSHHGRVCVLACHVCYLLLIFLAMLIFSSLFVIHFFFLFISTSCSSCSLFSVTRNFVCPLLFLKFSHQWTESSCA